MANDDSYERHPNRLKPEARRTKAVIAFLLLVVAGLVAVITIGGWDKLEVILIIFAAVAGPAWFARDKTGFENPTLPEPLLGFLTLLLIPVSLVLIMYAMRGFQQGWNIEAGTRAFLDQQDAEVQPQPQ
jgi:asparagine N-glycosylation enzyme membrane subunit Stt3